MNDDQRPLPVVIDQIGHLQTLRWPDTGEITYRTVLPSNEFEREDKYVRMIFYVRDDIPMIAQLYTLRKLFSELSQVALSELLDVVKNQRQIDLGVYSIAEGRHIVSMAQEHNLDIRIEELE